MLKYKESEIFKYNKNEIFEYREDIGDKRIEEKKDCLYLFMPFDHMFFCFFLSFGPSYPFILRWLISHLLNAFVSR